MNWFDETFLADLAEPIADGRVVIESDRSTYPQLLQDHFFLRLGRVDWTKAELILAAMLPGKQRTATAGKQGARQPKTVIQWFLAGAAIHADVNKDDEMVFVGDEVNHVARLAFGTAVDYCHTLFSFPQNAQIAPLSCMWVVEYTFEDCINFGFARQASTQDG